MTFSQFITNLVARKYSQSDIADFVKSVSNTEAATERNLNDWNKLLDRYVLSLEYHNGKRIKMPPL